MFIPCTLAPWLTYFPIHPCNQNKLTLAVRNSEWTSHKREREQIAYIKLLSAWVTTKFTQMLQTARHIQIYVYDLFNFVLRENSYLVNHSITAVYFRRTQTQSIAGKQIHNNAFVTHFICTSYNRSIIQQQISQYFWLLNPIFFVLDQIFSVHSCPFWWNNLLHLQGMRF